MISVNFKEISLNSKVISVHFQVISRNYCDICSFLEDIRDIC